MVSPFHAFVSCERSSAVLARTCASSSGGTIRPRMRPASTWNRNVLYLKNLSRRVLPQKTAGSNNYASIGISVIWAQCSWILLDSWNRTGVQNPQKIVLPFQGGLVLPPADRVTAALCNKHVTTNSPQVSSRSGPNQGHSLIHNWSNLVMFIPKNSVWVNDFQVFWPIITYKIT